MTASCASVWAADVHFDRMKAPLWVAQRWTRYDFARMHDTDSQPRPWQEDLGLPAYARGGTQYDGNKTELDRGHMARHAMKRGWGADASNCLPKGGFGVPDATYKIVGWFDAHERFQARAYLFEQPNEDADPGNGVDLE